MNRNSTVMLALLTTLVYSGIANAQSCSNGKTVYTKSNSSTSGLSCSSTDCHGSKPAQDKNYIQRGAGNAGQIDAALDGTTTNQSMVALDLRNNLPLTPSDVLDLAMYIFVANAQGNCPAGTPNVAATPSNINFGSVANGGTSAPTLVTVTNSGNANATGMVYSNSAITKWLVTGTTCGAMIPAGGSCSFSIAYKPSAAGANDSGTYSASGANGFTISLSGSSPTVVVPTPANLQATPASVAFGSVTVGSNSSVQAISIRNLGTTGATSVSFANSNSVKFAIGGQSCSTSLAGGATCGFNLTYMPSAVASDSGSITVGYTGGSVIIGLSGAGTAGTPPPPPPPPPPTAQTVNLIEYYHAAFGHYFVTYLQAEIDKLDTGTFAGWARTGKQFKAWTSPGTGLSPVCRFFTNYIDFAPKSSHFYTPDAPECTVVQANKVWQYEGQVFYTQQPSVTGVCPANTVPVYRMYNNGQSGAPNHRYTTDFSVRTEMIAVTKTPAPWIPEGAGAIGVIMCAPP